MAPTFNNAIKAAGGTPARRRGPVENGRDAVLSVYPDAYVTSNRRTADDPLTKANPTSYHYSSGGAVDVRPIEGMDFDQYVQGFRDRGYDIIEAKNEVGAGHSRHATGDHWHIVLGGEPTPIAAPTFNKAISGLRAAEPAGNATPVMSDDAGPTPMEAAAAERDAVLANGPVKPQVETATASAVVVPAVMQQPISPEEEAKLKPYEGIIASSDDPERMLRYLLAKERGLDDDQINAVMENRVREVEAAKAKAEAEQQRDDLRAAGGDPIKARADAKLRDAEGRLATLVQSATLGLADDVVGLVAPETAEDIRKQRDDYSRRNPFSATLVQLMGGAAPAGALNATLRRAGASGIPIVSGVGRNLTAFETAAGIGPKVRNALRVGGQGAILGAADAAGNGESAVDGAIMGGIGGTVAGPLFEGVVKGARALLASRAGASIRALAGRLGETPRALARRWMAAEAVLGRAPSIAEVSSPDLAQELRALGLTHRSADAVLKGARDEGARLRPSRTADAMTGDNIPAPLARRAGAGGPTANVGDELVMQREAMDNAMLRIGGEPVPVSGDEFQQFMGMQEIQALAARDPQLRRAMARAAQDFTDNPDPDFVTDAFTVRDLEGLRQLLRGAQADAATGNIGVQYGRMADEIADLISAEVPAFRAAMDDFGRRSRRITGVKTGEAGRTAADADSVELRRDLLTDEGAEGIEEGFRTRLRDQARSGEVGAERTLKSLSEDGDTQRILRGTMGDDEARRLGRFGRYERTAADRLEEAARGTSPTDRRRMADLLAQTADVATVGASAATIGYKARILTRLLRSFAMSSAKARRIALLATRPDRARATIDAMLEEGLSEAQIREVINQLGGAAGVAVNE